MTPFAECLVEVKDISIKGKIVMQHTKYVPTYIPTSKIFELLDSQQDGGLQNISVNLSRGNTNFILII